MKKFLALIIVITLMLGATAVSASAQQFEISDELFSAIKAELPSHFELTKDNISIIFMREISQGKYVLKYLVDGIMYPDDMREIYAGGYTFTTSRPEPVIFAYKRLTEIDDAYKQGVINDNDLKVMATFEELDMVRTKTTPELEKKVEHLESDEYINVLFKLEDFDKSVIDFREPDEEYLSALEKLNAHHENLHKQLTDEVLKDIEFIDQIHNGGLSIVSIKCSDVKKAAQSELVKEMEYISEIHLKYIRQYDVSLSTHFYEEKCVVHDDNYEPSYVLLEANNGEGCEQVIAFRFGRVIVYSPAIYTSFTYRFGIYDIKEDKFYDIYDLKDTPYKYTNLEWLLSINSEVKPVGDSDGDGAVTILDATNIQRCVAKIGSLSDDDSYLTHESDGAKNVSDADNDGEITILDATQVQLLVAHVEDSNI